MAFLYKTYKNGNYTVQLFSDGTKIRLLDKDETEFKPVFPENIDLKISDKCSIGCAYCHENSCPEGKVARGLDKDFYLDPLKEYELRIDNNNFNYFLLNCKPGTELAIGGGALSELNEQLWLFLAACYQYGIIANITVNSIELLNDKFFSKLLCYVSLLNEKCDRWKRLKLFLTQHPEFNNDIHGIIGDNYINGLGISYNNNPKCKERMLYLKRLFPTAVVIHTIFGITTKEDYDWLAENGFKVLILGYKNFRRGEDYYEKNSERINQNMNDLKNNLNEYYRKCKRISFDCLATEQLKLKEFVNDDTRWEQSYMGDDGKFTMYVDMVNEVCAKNSTSTKRFSCCLFNYNPTTMFKIFQNNTLKNNKESEGDTTCQKI